MAHNNPCLNHLCLMQTSLLIGCLAIHRLVVGRNGNSTPTMCVCVCCQRICSVTLDIVTYKLLQLL